MSTQQANEASSAHVRTGGARVSLPRPHLVSAAEKRTRSQASSADAGNPGADVEIGAPGSDLQWIAYTGRFTRLSTTRGRLGTLTKRAIDIVGALLLGLIFAPLMLLIVILTHRQGGPIIYRHRRVGRDGKMFGCLKFRTMVPNADEVLRDLLERDAELKAEWVRDHKLRTDPRVTPLGRFLRRTSLDELPQIWNVLRGEMSLVGPRPVVREECLRYGRNIRAYLAAKPGITGLWQVTGRNDTDYRRRVALDTYYVRNQSLPLDLYILMKTTFVVLGRTGAY